MKAERVQQQQQQKEIKYTSQELEVELTTVCLAINFFRYHDMC